MRLLWPLLSWPLLGFTRVPVQTFFGFSALFVLVPSRVRSLRLVGVMFVQWMRACVVSCSRGGGGTHISLPRVCLASDQRVPTIDSQLFLAFLGAFLPAFPAPLFLIRTPSPFPSLPARSLPALAAGANSNPRPAPPRPALRHNRLRRIGVHKCIVSPARFRLAFRATSELRLPLFPDPRLSPPFLESPTSSLGEFAPYHLRPRACAVGLSRLETFPPLARRDGPSIMPFLPFSTQSGYPLSRFDSLARAGWI
ncbi:hypothetical protein MSAN_01193600 [Mycena sanguinolenta]|uniref:Uncharacterized protein n=1 Tax=Mycena sanguinolenta TaxID=230812 RepID=A0A8H6YPH0_9AGAR|nr:hypothetical protein MSAN_01193600 [Mycena sanguinolenta]